MLSFFLLIISWTMAPSELAKAYEKIATFKRLNMRPKSLCETCMFERSIPCTIQQLMDTQEVELVHSCCGREVYLTGDYVVKVYSKKAFPEFLNEVWSIETLHRHGPKSFAVPTIVSLYRVVGAFNIYHLLIEEKALGAHLDQAGSSRAYYRFGQALAELHSLKSGKNKSAFFRQTTLFRKCPYSLQQKSTKAKKTGYTQFDVQPVNALYHEESDQITLLDLAHIGQFTDRDSNPTMPAVYDFAYFASLLTREAYEHFVSGYQENGGERFADHLLKTYAELALLVQANNDAFVSRY